MNKFLFYPSSLQITSSWYLIDVEHMIRNGNSIEQMWQKTQ